MASITNTATTISMIGNREDLADVIYNISPIDTPFQKSVAKAKATAVTHEWQVDSLAAVGPNAQMEGDDTQVSYSFQTVSPTVRLSNTCQISRKDVVVSGTQDSVSKAGREREYTYQLVKRGKELRRDMEAILTGNQSPVPASGASLAVARVLRPLAGWYTSNVQVGAGATVANGATTSARIDGTARSLTETLLKSAVQQAWKQGGDPDLIMVGPFNKTVISTFTGNNTRMQDTSDGTLAAAIDVYESDFGSHKIVANRFQRERDLHVLTTDLWAVATLRAIQTKDLAKTGDNEKAMIVTEYTLEARNEAGSALIADLTTQ